MKPGPTNLLDIAGKGAPPIGFHDVPDPEQFDPFCTPKRCLFACYENWAQGESICLSEGSCTCRGGRYWIGGAEFATRDDFATGLIGLMHISASVFITDDERGLHADYERWTEELAPHAPPGQYLHNRTGEARPVGREGTMPTPT